MRKEKKLPAISDLPRLSAPELQALHQEMFGAKRPMPGPRKWGTASNRATTLSVNGAAVYDRPPAFPFRQVDRALEAGVRIRLIWPVAGSQPSTE